LKKERNNKKKPVINENTSKDKLKVYQENVRSYLINLKSTPKKSNLFKVDKCSIELKNYHSL